jgi:integrase
MFPASETTTPNIVNLTVPQRRSRRYLTEKEIEQLMDCARKHSRHGHRDATMILVAYRHGLRASELCDLQWHQIELSEGRLHVHRVKNGTPSVHPIRGDEMRALRKLRRDHPSDADQPHWFSPAYPAPRQGRENAFRHPSAHAPACLRIRLGECRPRHPSTATLPRSQEHPAYGAVHGIGC